MADFGSDEWKREHDASEGIKRIRGAFPNFPEPPEENDDSPSSASPTGYTDTQRIDWLEEQEGRVEIWCDASFARPHFSVDGGETWHQDLRDAIDAAMSV